MTTSQDSFPIRLGGNAVLDARKLLDTRLLVTGNSGAGKSWLARLLAESVAKHVPIIVLDPEGEFVSLREAVDLVVVSAEGGDLAPSVRTAGLLARRLLELSQSAVIDLYSLKLGERRTFVRLFLDALLAAPREHWHPLFVVLDEAHRYAPEQGRDASEATDSVITLLSQGRKRGICGVLLTQRLSKLHKDAAAECVNILVGRTTLPNDVDRAADLLSMHKKDAAFLRKLPVGEWCGFGPAFVSDEDIVRFRAGAVKTTHPESGRQHLRPPAPSSKIKKVLAELQDLDERVEAEENEVEELRRRCAELETELDARGGVQIASDPSELDAAREEGFASGWGAAAWRMRTLLDQTVVPDLGKILSEAAHMVTKMIGRTELGEHNGESQKLSPLERERIQHRQEVLRTGQLTPFSVSTEPRPTPTTAHRAAPTTNGIGRGAPWKLLAAMLQHGRQTRERFCALAGVAPTAGNTNNAFGKLRAAGMLVDFPDKTMEPSHKATKLYGNKVAPLPTGAALLDYWANKLGDGAPGKIFAALRQLRGRPATRERICQLAGVQPTAGNTNNAFGKLRSRGIVTDHPGKLIALSANLL